MIAQVSLSAITKNADDTRQAWLAFPGDSPTRFVHEGDKITVDGSHLEVLRIAPDRVELQIDGIQRQVHIGETLQ